MILTKAELFDILEKEFSYLKENFHVHKIVLFQSSNQEQNDPIVPHIKIILEDLDRNKRIALRKYLSNLSGFEVNFLNPYGSRYHGLKYNGDHNIKYLEFDESTSKVKRK